MKDQTERSRVPPRNRNGNETLTEPAERSRGMVETLKGGSEDVG